VRADHEVLLEVDNNISLIVEDPQGILDHQFKPRLYVYGAGFLINISSSAWLLGKGGAISSLLLYYSYASIVYL
jgi:hypothetical protein